MNLVQYGYRQRDTYARIPSLMEMPDLIETQQKSYRDFLQADVLPDRRVSVGMQGAFETVFPIKGRDGSSLEFVNYNFGRPKYNVQECVDREMTYAAPLRIRVRLVVKRPGDKEDTSELVDIREEDIYLGELPMMTEKGTFIINGAERIVVSQLHRSPGPVFGVDVHPTGHRLVQASIIPNRGAWLEFENDLKNVHFVLIDRKRKIPVTCLLRAFGLSTDQQIMETFAQAEQVNLTKRFAKKNLVGKMAGQTLASQTTGKVICERGDVLSDDQVEELKDSGNESILVVDGDESRLTFLTETMLKDPSTDQESALLEIYQHLRPGEPPVLKNAQALVENLFSKSRRYDLSRVGRYRMNKKLGLDVSLDEVTLCLTDLIGVVQYMLNLEEGKGLADDIDHLGNRRVRTIGELLEGQIRIGLARMERSIREKMGILDLENIMPRNLINAKPITAAINEFFGRSQLSQFLDQINPLAELTHKRRLSALGPGGLNRERAGFEVRDVHHTHYGRICPIETPEGPNIGLIFSLATFGHINQFGFIETPYRKVEKGNVTGVIESLTADDEDECIIAQANTALEGKRLAEDPVLCRHRGEFPLLPPGKVDYMDISPMQLVSVSAALIPFLEHDDANRALMGSNMQRQAVPLLKTEAPLIATGVEYKAAKDSGVVLVAKRPGKVVSADSRKIVIRRDDTEETDLDACDEYILQKFQRSNQNTCINQKPLVRGGERVSAGQVIADGPATDWGELALGKNILVAFMSWEGYNFEDAIIVSDRLLQEDVFTSIHIEEFKTEARDTKLGEEEITRDIPNVGEEALRNLDDEGIIRVGAQVKPGDILVGKISPKGKVQTSNVEKLLRAIFGKRAEDVRDISLKAHPGTEGTVVDVKVFSRKVRTGKAKTEDDRKIKKLTAEMDQAKNNLETALEQKSHQMAVGKVLKQDLIDYNTGEVIALKGEKITKANAAKADKISIREIFLEDSEDIERMILDYESRIEDVKHEYEKRIEYIKTGDNLPPGVIKMVKVYVAKKKKLSVGDKMAGRHGNKGVVSKILPVEEMPFLDDGTPVDIILNPLGVPSRMNVGQVMETHLGWAAQKKGKMIASPVFDGATYEDIVEELSSCGLPETGKAILYDGRSGDPFEQSVTVGNIYMMKLNHLVDDKIHARCIGPYSLVTQQPLGGKAQFGGQRFGEMEVWALEAYGSAHILQELLTVKSDDITGRNKIYEAIVKGQDAKPPGLPESFYVLIKELQSLGLGIDIESEEDVLGGPDEKSEMTTQEKLKILGF